MAARGNKWWVLAVVILPLFMALLDRSLVVIAIPRITEELGGGLSEASWIVNGYILAFVAAIVIGGRMGDLWGRRRLFLVGVVAFTVGSLACAIATEMPMLVGSRVVQGLGGAVMLPQTLALLTVAFPPGQRGLALGLWSAASGLGTALGPIVGGLVLTVASWRWVFLVNVPVAFVAFLGALCFVPESHAENVDRRLDWLGMALIMVSTASVTGAVIEGQGLGWRSPVIVGLFALSAASTVLLYFVERGRPNALIPPSLFHARAFTAANFDGLLSFFGFVGVTFLVPIFLQGQGERDALTAGLLLTPLPVALMLASAGAGRLTDYLGGRWLIFAGMAIAAAGIFILVGLTPEIAYLDLLVPLAIAGFGMGTALAPTATVVMTSVSPARLGNASGILGTFRMFGAVLGVAVMSAVLENRFLAGLRAALEGARIDPVEKQRLLAQAGEGARQMLFAGTSSGSAEVNALVSRELMAALATAFVVAAGLSLLGAIIALAIPASAGKHQPSRGDPQRPSRG
ncbi:MAG: DHA2 family efflux MFS transporter permease subunit [Myxococcales bacterium]|jgi:EmrB/QacA subfamily drug resistance transporter